MSQVFAPWKAEEVDAIIAWQKNPLQHPFTCAGGHHLALIATRDKLTCPYPGCTYEQYWVHDFMIGTRR